MPADRTSVFMLAVDQHALGGLVAAGGKTVHITALWPSTNLKRSDYKDGSSFFRQRLRADLSWLVDRCGMLIYGLFHSILQIIN